MSNTYSVLKDPATDGVTSMRASVRRLDNLLWDVKNILPKATKTATKKKKILSVKSPC